MVTAVGWCVALTLGMPEGSGRNLFFACIGLMFALVLVVRIWPPPVVIADRRTMLTRIIFYVVVFSGLAAASVGRFTERGRLLQVGVAVVLAVTSLIYLLNTRRIARLWPTSTGVLAGENHLAEDEL